MCKSYYPNPFIAGLPSYKRKTKQRNLPIGVFSFLPRDIRDFRADEFDQRLRIDEDLRDVNAGQVLFFDLVGHHAKKKSTLAGCFHII